MGPDDKTSSAWFMDSTACDDIRARASAQPTCSLELIRKSGPLPDQPFTPDSVPLRIKARAKKISGWTLDKDGLVGKLHQSPVRSQEPEETITLIPMGAARLRISAFPAIGSGSDAKEW